MEPTVYGTLSSWKRFQVIIVLQLAGSHFECCITSMDINQVEIGLKVNSSVTRFTGVNQYDGKPN